MLRKARFILPLVVLALGAIVVACGDDEKTPTAVPTIPATTVPTTAPTLPPGATVPAGVSAIAIANFAFAPAELTVPAGTTVQVTNGDSAPHTVTAVDGSFDTGTLSPGSSGTITLDTAGTFDFKCNLHASMKGKITVQ